MSIIQQLLKFDQELRFNNNIEYQKLQPPLSKIEIKGYLQRVALDNTDLFDIYLWKNGAKIQDDCRIMKHGAFVPIESLVTNELHKDNPYYDQDLITIIDDAEEKLLFNSKSNSLQFGKIYLFSVPLLYIDFPISIYDSLYAMMETNTLAYEKGIYKYDSEKKYLHCDYKQYAKIAKQINNGSMYWKEHDPLREEDWYEV